MRADLETLHNMQDTVHMLRLYTARYKKETLGSSRRL
jgi:hypothetical protein